MNRATKTGGKKRPWWFPLTWAVPLVIVVVLAAVFVSRWYLGTDSGQDFLAAYPGEVRPEGGPGGFPWWVQWQHALNFIFILLLIRSGYLIHSQRQPEAYWTRRNTGRLKTKNPPKKMSLYLWLHLSMDVLWVLNGIIFVIALLVSDQWRRIVPLSWDIFGNAASAALQYASFDWPLNTPFVSYNALQVLAYFSVVFLAGPLAAITGIRMSPVWSNDWKVSKIYPVKIARAIHLPVMYYFAAFIVVHVALVFTTGMRLNLNTMYAATGQGSESWWGLVVFLVTLLVAVVGWAAARPMFMQPVASMTGRVSAR